MQKPQDGMLNSEALEQFLTMFQEVTNNQAMITAILQRKGITTGEEMARTLREVETKTNEDWENLKLWARTFFD